MKFSFKFNNLLGTVYRKGDLLFTPDGNSVISPVGNRITIYDLKNNKSFTLPIESRLNYTALDLAPNGCFLIAINEEGDAHMISLVSYTIFHRYRFKGKVSAVKFSPDGKHFAVCKENKVFVFEAPGIYTGTYNNFVMERVFHDAYDVTTCIDWSSDSKILAVGSKDCNIKIYPIDKFANFSGCTLSSHSDVIVGCFFEANNYDITTIGQNGQTYVWECSIEPSDLILKAKPKKMRKIAKDDNDSEDDIDESKIIERTDTYSYTGVQNGLAKYGNNSSNTSVNMIYNRLTRHYLGDEARKENKEAIITAAAYHRKTKILVIGFSSGAFFIYELPELNQIHSLSISEQNISTICLNCTGDWIALGCGGLGQLLVWEWQSETYVMKQQGHSNNMSCVSYSTDGQLLVTGGEDGKVKLWNIQSGFCFVTFNEHTAPITDVVFSANKKFIISSSLDGTCRAYDIIRYRNFRTLTTPRPIQLVCVAVDSSGEFVAAGGQDVFEIFLWSLKLGRLLEILSGHEAPVWSLAFNPNPNSTALASVSWDKTLRLWDALEKGSAHETIQLNADGLSIVYKPDGEDVSVATLDGNIHIFNVRTATQLLTIEGRNDLGSGMSELDLISAKKTLQAKSFTSLCYSADGNYILAGGQSKNVCIYNVQDGILITKFEITQNRSLDAVDDFINRRKLTEFGNVALVEEREELEGGPVAIRLPGVRRGDMVGRTIAPEVRIFSLQFSPTGQAWAAATTEGLLIYSLNTGLVFDPWNLELDITPISVRATLAKGDFDNALMMSMKLNESALIQEVIENIPAENIELIISNLSVKYIERLMVIMSNALDSSPHIEFYLTWIQNILTLHGQNIKPQINMPALLSLQKSLHKKYDDLAKICDFNKYTIQYICNLGAKVALEENKKEITSMEVDSEEEEESITEE